MKIFLSVLLIFLSFAFAQDDSFVDVKSPDSTTSIDSQKASIVELEKLAEKGDAKAQCELGIHYGKGEGVDKNYEMAVKW